MIFSCSGCVAEPTVRPFTLSVRLLSLAAYFEKVVGMGRVGQCRLLLRRAVRRLSCSIADNWKVFAASQPRPQELPARLKKIYSTVTGARSRNKEKRQRPDGRPIRENQIWKVQGGRTRELPDLNSENDVVAVICFADHRSKSKRAGSEVRTRRVTRPTTRQRSCDLSDLRPLHFENRDSGLNKKEIKSPNFQRTLFFVI